MPGPGLDTIDEAELEALSEVFRQRSLSRYRFDEEAEGEAASFTWRFERDLEALSGVRHCLGMNSCTSALLAGLWAAGIGPGDEVIVPGYTFVASIATIAYTGALPVLAEIDGSLTIDPGDVERRIGPRTKAILCVHMLGLPCDMTGLTDVAERHGLLLIEDCAQSGGGRHGGRFLGSFGAFGAMSLNVFKTMTAGDGGVLLTDDPSLFETAFAIHDHGARPYSKGVAEGNGLLGLNLRMHEITGAVAWAQLRKLPANLERLRQLKAEFAGRIGPLPGALPVGSHDPQGECATVLPITFGTAERAQRFAERLGTRPLIRSGKHYYGNIPQLTTPLLPRGIQAPELDPRRFARGALPATDDLLARTVALSVGVRDSYLGTGFGLHIRSSGDEIVEKARLVRLAAEP